jgi:hypothetical protein
MKRNRDNRPLEEIFWSATPTLSIRACDLIGFIKDISETGLARALGRRIPEPDRSEFFYFQEKINGEWIEYVLSGYQDRDGRPFQCCTLHEDRERTAPDRIIPAELAKVRAYIEEQIGLGKSRFRPMRLRRRKKNLAALLYSSSSRIIDGTPLET